MKTPSLIIAARSVTDVSHEGRNTDTLSAFQFYREAFVNDTTSERIRECVAYVCIKGI